MLVLLLVIEGDSITSTSTRIEMSTQPAIDASGKVYFPMTRTIKAALLVFLLSLCALAAVFSPREPARERDSKTQVTPVNNHQRHRGIWLRV
ncbi:MAG: hypothetical protein QOD64_448 [Verrucomicrobiota bacterium]